MNRCGDGLERTAAFAFSVLVLASTAAAGPSFETQALRISENIREQHLPFGTVVSPMYESAESSGIATYTRCGDSAIWTGHWLAAESFRYAVTGTDEALRNAQVALEGVHRLVRLTGGRVLARCTLPVNSRFSEGPRREEAHHGEYPAEGVDEPWVWIGNTSRDQYLGVFFGLSAAYENVPELRDQVREVVAALLDPLLENEWRVVLPDGSVSTVFWLRPDQQLALLLVGRQVDPDRFSDQYEDLRRHAFSTELVVWYETANEHTSYFKFNLLAITFFQLLRLEELDSPRRSEHEQAYERFRKAVASHGNAAFNAVDLALRGANETRDTETAELLRHWLQRPPRDEWLDLRDAVPACGKDRACDPIPVPLRVRTDYLWQRSPFLLYGGGVGRIQEPGIDFILPYWMARRYGLEFND
jgi:hypothetical protein